MNATEVRTRHVEQAAPAVLKPRQMRELVRAPDLRTRHGYRDAALLSILALGGLRIGECVRLTLDCLDFVASDKVRLTFRCSKSRVGSPARYRTVTLTGRGAKTLRDYVERSALKLWLFEGRRGEHLSTRGANKIAKHYMREVGAGAYRVHDLRHSFASIVVRETRSIFTAQKLLGHASPATTARFYAAFEVSDSDNAADAVSSALARRQPRSR